MVDLTRLDGCSAKSLFQRTNAACGLDALTYNTLALKVGGNFMIMWRSMHVLVLYGGHVHRWPCCRCFLSRLPQRINRHATMHEHINPLTPPLHSLCTLGLPCCKLVFQRARSAGC